MAGRPFSDQDDLYILRARSKGVGFREIGAALGRNKDAVRDHYLRLTERDRYRPGRPPGFVTGPPIAAWPVPIDDQHHVNALRRQGGFRPLAIYAERYA